LSRYINEVWTLVYSSGDDTAHSC